MIRGTTYKRKDGRWECRISLGSESGHKKFRSFYGKTKEEAEYKMVMASQSSEHTTEQITEMTVKELALEWFSAIKNRIKESTAANYRMKIEKHIIPVFGGRPRRPYYLCGGARTRRCMDSCEICKRSG